MHQVRTLRLATTFCCSALHGCAGWRRSLRALIWPKQSFKRDIQSFVPQNYATIPPSILPHLCSEPPRSDLDMTCELQGAQGLALAQQRCAKWRELRLGTGDLQQFQGVLSNQSIPSLCTSRPSTQQHASMAHAAEHTQGPPTRRSTHTSKRLFHNVVRAALFLAACLDALRISTCRGRGGMVNGTRLPQAQHALSCVPVRDAGWPCTLSRSGLLAALFSPASAGSHVCAAQQG
jgi:hypothetical protein